MKRNFDGFVFSCDYKILKPNLELYKILFKKYNLIPEECFFIDDKKQNIEAGEILGGDNEESIRSRDEEIK